MAINQNECDAAGFVDARWDGRSSYDIALLEKRLARAAKEAQRLGVILFAGSGALTIRSQDDLILAHVEGPNLWDGGDGGVSLADDGLLRGERTI